MGSDGMISNDMELATHDSWNMCWYDTTIPCWELTNITPTQGMFEDDFPFPKVPWRVSHALGTSPRGQKPSPNKQIGMVTHQKERKEGHTQRQIFWYSGSRKKAQRLWGLITWILWNSNRAMSVSLQGKVSRPRQYPHKRYRQWCGDGPSFTLATCCKEILKWGGKAHPARAMKAPCPSNTYLQTKLR